MKQPKISEMVIDVAWDFIGQGSTIEDRRTRLKTACTAWNYACVPQQVTTKLLDEYMVDYRKWNPDVETNETRAFRQQLESLVREKIKKYPHVISQIISCELVVEKGEERLNVVTVREGY